MRQMITRIMFVTFLRASNLCIYCRIVDLTHCQLDSAGHFIFAAFYYYVSACKTFNSVNKIKITLSIIVSITVPLVYFL